MLDRLRKQLDERGTLDVLRQPLQLAQFRPALAINPEIQAKYATNRLRVVRQVRYSVHNENCIDLVLFLNGLPVATVELKTDFTHSMSRQALDSQRVRSGIKDVLLGPGQLYEALRERRAAV